MTTPARGASRQHLVIASVIVIAVVVIVGGIVAATYVGRPAATHTTAALYNVTFKQGGACSPPVYTIPWSVTLGGRTEAEPSNATLPIANGPYTAGPEPPGLYTIVFTSVPDGVYQYKIAPSGPFYTTSGTIRVNGTDVSVPVDGPVVSCVATTSTKTTTSGTPPNASSFSPSTSACTSSSQIATTTNDSAVFNLGTMPSNFTVGGYRFVMEYNGTGYGTSSNGTEITYLGYSLVFSITHGGELQTVMFGSAPPAPYPPTVPSPSTATAFGGAVHMQWVATCNAIFFEIDTS